MLLPKVKLPPDQRSLLDNYLALNESDQTTLRAFAEFLADRSSGAVGESDLPTEPVLPKAIPRPQKESVIGAIKRLSETYYMIDRKDLLTETSSLMSAHIMHGRSAPEVIDELEALFAIHYKRHNNDGD